MISRRIVVTFLAILFMVGGGAVLFDLNLAPASRDVVIRNQLRDLYALSERYLEEHHVTSVEVRQLDQEKLKQARVLPQFFEGSYPTAVVKNAPLQVTEWMATTLWFITPGTSPTAGRSA